MVKRFKKISDVVRLNRVCVPGLSQQKLANKIGYKNGQFISNVERGKCGLPAKDIEAVSKLLDVNSSVLKKAMVEDYARHLEQVCP